MLDAAAEATDADKAATKRVVDLPELVLAGAVTSAATRARRRAPLIIAARDTYHVHPLAKQNAPR